MGTKPPMPQLKFLGTIHLEKVFISKAKNFILFNVVCGIFFCKQTQKNSFVSFNRMIKTEPKRFQS